jgi:catechol 2,3-dioxygenase-like lactoylglutathione lyase family enzyme
MDPKTNGAGTVTAAAALFLASRYAASPLQGMVLAATTTGADTDTLASMTGSILAAIHGQEWLGHFGASVQDANYLHKIAISLVDKSRHREAGVASRVRKKEASEFLNSLRVLEPGAKLRLPDGRSGTLKKIEEMFSQTARAELCRIEIDDGQTVAIKRIERGVKSGKSGHTSSGPGDAEEILRVGIRLYVTDLRKARDFYVNKLHLPLDKEYPGGLTVAGIISLQLTEKGHQAAFRLHTDSLAQAIPCIRVRSLSEMKKRLSMNGIPIFPPNGSHSYKAIQILDPFGNTLEIFEA